MSIPQPIAILHLIAFALWLGGTLPLQAQSDLPEGEGEWSLIETDAAIEVAHAGQLVLRYHKQRVEAPTGWDAVYGMSGFVHPLRTLSGITITEAFATGHPHHSGLWSAWTRTTIAGRSVDFWNLHKQEGRVEHRGVDWVDRETPSFQVRKVYVDLTADTPTDRLEEIWTFSDFRLQPNGWSFDIHTTQRLIGADPVTLEVYHYGGLSLRLRDAWHGSPEGAQVATVQNDAGHDRLEADQQPAQWILTSGTLDDHPVSILAMNHPESDRFPQVVRYHPTMPYFVWTPPSRTAFVFDAASRYQAQYRYQLADTHLSKAEADEAFASYRQ